MVISCPGNCDRTVFLAAPNSTGSSNFSNMYGGAFTGNSVDAPDWGESQNWLDVRYNTVLRVPGSYGSSGGTCHSHANQEAPPWPDVDAWIANYG
jgi:hypothetical protein